MYFTESLDPEDGPSCSAAEALDRQEPFVNQTLAQHALALLSRLFRYGRIEHHGAFVNVAQNRVRPLAISPQEWKKMSRRGRKHLRNGRASDQRCVFIESSRVKWRNPSPTLGSIRGLARCRLEPRLRSAGQSLRFVAP